MALSMSRPWKHPKTGVYWLRKRVPNDLRLILGKLEEKKSLNTRDPVEAKLRHLQALTELEARWTNLRAGPKSLTEREAHELAAPAYAKWIEQHKDNPSEQSFWVVDLAPKLWAPVELKSDWNTSASDFSRSLLDPERLKLAEMAGWCFELADQCLAAHGMIVDQESRLRLAKAIAAAVQRASQTLARFATGVFDEPTPLKRNHRLDSHPTTRAKRKIPSSSRSF